LGISLSAKRCEEIKKIIVDMFIKFGISDIPISSFEIASKMGVKLYPYSAFPPEKRVLLLKKSEDGFSLEKGIGEWFIYYNDNCGYGRSNNTIMHENGHIVLDHTEDSELAEKEVRFFAKYALAPPVLVHKFNLNAPWQISKAFKVSAEAALYAFNYYKKCLNYGGEDYKDYELLMLGQFKKMD